MEINERITKVMEYSGLSPAGFAEEIGIQRSSISHIISGRNKPSLDFVMKIKTSFPEIKWDWLIIGEGEMMASKESPKNSEDTEKKKKSIPDLFSLLDDDNFGVTESEDRTQKQKPRESTIPSQLSNSKNINDSQQLEKKIKNIRKIVFFYDNGTFETYEN